MLIFTLSFVCFFPDMFCMPGWTLNIQKNWNGLIHNKKQSTCNTQAVFIFYTWIAFLKEALYMKLFEGFGVLCYFLSYFFSIVYFVLYVCDVLKLYRLH